MSHLPGRIRAGLLLVSFALLSSPTAFAAQRTFVSTAGSDSNTASNCSNTLPCRGFAAALTVTDSGGEIIVQNSGGYGPVTINKSVSLIAPEGVYAGISVTVGFGITIATAGVNVMLRGLSINSLGGSSGVYMTNGNALAVERCHIANFFMHGISVANPAAVRVLGSVFADNGTGARLVGGARASVEDTHFSRGGNGVVVSATGGEDTRVSVSRSSARFGTVHGFQVMADTGGTSALSIRDSVASQNASVGYYAYSDASSVRLEVIDSEASANSYGVVATSVSAGLAQANVSSSLITRNDTFGLVASGGSVTLTAGGNTVTHNGVGLYQDSGAVFESAGDNIVRQNFTATAGTITTVSKL